MTEESSSGGHQRPAVHGRANAAADILARIEHGFRIRSLADQDRLLRVRPRWIEQERPSVFAALTSRLDHSASAPPYQGDDRWVFVEAALTAPTLVDQRHLVASITHPQDAPFVSTYCLGALFAEQVIDMDAAVLADSTDLSIIFESLAVSGRGDAVLSAALALSDHFLAGGFSSSRDDSSFTLLRHRFVEASPARGGELVQFQRRVQMLKHSYVHTFGPDIFSSLQALVEPEIGLTGADLLLMERLFGRWGLTNLFCQLLLLRLLGAYPTEQQYLRERLGDLIKLNITARQAHYVRVALHAGGSDTPARPRRVWGLDAFVLFMARLHTSLLSSDTGTLTDSVIDLYELDPAVIGFLPWDRISRVLAAAPRDPRAAFLTLLMTDEAVRKRYPMVGLRLGKGALIADLQALIDIRRPDAIGALLGQVKTLPTRAAGALARAILDRPIMERLASSLPDTHRWIGELPALDRARVSTMTLSALRAAGQRNLIPEAEVRRHIEREVEDLRFHMLQSQLRTGRVKVPWVEIGKGLDAFFEQALPMTALRLSAAQSSSTGLAPRLADYTAQRIASFLVLESEYCIKQALSSNLRHGVMLPRFLRAFDDAVQTTWGAQSLLAWEHDAVRERMGEDGLLILALRERVSDLIKRHMAEWLDVEEDSGFQNLLKEALRGRIIAHFSSGQPGRRSALRSAIVASTRGELGKLLRRAAKDLAGPTRRQVNQELRVLGRTLKGRAAPELRSYVDFLQSNIHQAFEEVGQWVRLVSGRSEALPFSLGQIVRLHLLDSALFARAPLKVTTEVIVNGKARNDALIRRQYLGFFEEIVRNLLSNAFKGSGDEVKTQAEVQLSVTGRRMVLRCTNIINPNRLQKVLDAYRYTVEQAQRRDKVQARQDQRSGFQKIRVACEQAFGTQPRINIPPISPRLRRFIVELTVEMPREDLLVSER